MGGFLSISALSAKTNLVRAKARNHILTLIGEDSDHGGGDGDDDGVGDDGDYVDGGGRHDCDCEDAGDGDAGEDDDDCGVWWGFRPGETTQGCSLQRAEIFPLGWAGQ